MSEEILEGIMRPKYAIKHITMGALDQDPPVQDTWYEIVDIIIPCAIYSIVVKQTNDEANAENLEVKATVDGLAMGDAGGAFAATSGQNYYFRQWDFGDFLTHGTTLTLAQYYAVWKAQAFKVEARITTDLTGSTNEKLDGRVIYGEQTRY